MTLSLHVTWGRTRVRIVASHRLQPQSFQQSSTSTSESQAFIKLSYRFHRPRQQQQNIAKRMWRCTMRSLMKQSTRVEAAISGATATALCVHTVASPQVQQDLFQWRGMFSPRVTQHAAREVPGRSADHVCSAAVTAAPPATQSQQSQHEVRSMKHSQSIRAISQQSPWGPEYGPRSHRHCA